MAKLKNRPKQKQRKNKNLSGLYAVTHETAYKNGKSKFRPYVITKDNEGKSIRIGSKFIENSPKKDLSKADIIKIKKETFGKSKNSIANRNKVREIKRRK